MNAKRAVTSLLRRKALLVAVASCFAGYAQANPTNPTVISGAATFAASGKSLSVTNTPGAVINWQGFSIKADELTRFIQQNAQSAVLNRVTGPEQSAILGQLQSNGRVYLINPNGIAIGAGARIDTAGFVASSLSLSDGDALAGKFKLQDLGGSGKVINNGTITTASGGFVYLVAPDVENNGVITSPKGEIILAAGKSVELVDSQKPELRVLLTAPENTAVNVGKMIAEAGTIGIFAGVIKQSGLISANSAVVGENGKIFLKAKKDITLAAGSKTEASGPQGGSITIQSDGGAATVAGVVEANGTQGKGGAISVTAPVAVTVAPTARVSANGTEGGSVTLTSAAGPVTVAAPVTADASVGRAGQVAVNAATTAALASTGQLSASGGQGGGAVSVMASGGVTLEVGSVAQASGATGGSVTVQADQGAVEGAGTIAAMGNEGTGGSIQIAALSDITLDIASQILASGRSGGEVRIESGEGTLLASGLIDGQGKDGPGGRVWMLAPRVGLIREAVVNVSGWTGGGVALVGGDYQGKNPDVQNALQTHVGPDARIVADAVDTGNGGKVIVWADDITRFYGMITARGGVQGGKGGFAEVSGKEFLVYRGHTDLRASDGTAGMLFLDPRNITIQTTGVNTIAGNTLFGDNATADVTFTATDVKTAVETADVTLQANNDITVTNGFATTANNFSLSFEAGRSILINDSIAIGGAFNATANIANTAVVQANRTTASAGEFKMADSTTISTTQNTGAGNITIRVQTGDPDITLATDKASGNITISTLNAGAGSVLIEQGGATAGSSILRTTTSLITAGSFALDISNAANTTGTIGASGSGNAIEVTVSNLEARTRGGSVFVKSPTAGVTIGGATLGGLTGISTSGGNVTVSSAGTLDVTEAINTTPTNTGAGGTVNLEADGAITLSGSGTITTTGFTTGAGGEVFIHRTTAGATTEAITLGADITAKGAGAAGGAVVTVVNEDGSIAINAAIDASGSGGGNGGTIQLVSAGASSAITQAGTTSSTALLATGATGGLLKVSSGDTVTLENQTNDIQTLAATIVTQNRDFSYKDANSLNISTVAAAGNLSAPSGTSAAQAAMSGITTDGNVNVTTLAAGDLTVLKDILKSGTTAATTLTLQANQSIVFNNAASVKLASSATGTYTIVLNTDRDQGAVSGGAIQLNTNTLLNSNGGSITLGGGTTPSTTHAIGQGSLVEGILINGAQLQSGTGSIILNGTGLASTVGAHGIRIANSGKAQSSSGSITMTGIGGSGTNNDGVLLDTSASILSGSGAIQVKGTRAGSGVDIRTTGAGNVIGGATSSASSSDILLEAGGTSGISTDATIATSGSVTLNASAGGAITQTSGSILATGGANSALRLLGHAVTSTVANLTSTTNDVNVLVANLPGATSKLSYRDANGFDIGSLNKPTTLGGVIASNSGITVGTAAAAANILTLNAFGAVTQSQKITAGALQLLGGAGVSYTLTNALNDITTLAASTSGPISYRDANSYAVGTVASTNQFSVATIPTGSSTNGTTETGASGNFTATTVGIHTNAGGSVQLDVPGTLTINNDINTDGSFAQISSAGTGSVSITSPRSISTTSDAVSFASPVTLNGAGTNTTIDTRVGGGAGGDITFQSTLNAASAAPSAETLTLNAGTGGNILFSGAVGTGSRLGAISITNANNVTESAGITAASLTQAAGQGTTTFNGAVNTDTATGVNLTGNAQTVNAGITTTGAGTVTFSNAGLLTLNADISADGAVTQNGAGVVTINTDRTITTTADAVGFATNVTLNKTSGTGLLTINTTSGNAAGANITFSSKLDGTTAGAEPLTLNAGSAGDILFTGAVGGTARLGAINITNANDVTESAGIIAASLVQSAGTGTTLFSAPVNANTVTGVQIDTNNIITGSGGTITTTTGSSGIVTFDYAGALAIGAAIDADGDVTVNGSGLTTLSADIVTTSDLVQFYQPVLLTGNRLIDTLQAPALGAGGSIRFLKTVDGGGNSLTLAAPTATGNITFDQAASNLSALTVTSGKNFLTEAAAPISVGSGGMSVTVGGTTTINNTITTSASGSVTFTNGGLLTLNANITADGAVTQNGAGAVTINTDRTITTTADAVSFARDVTLNKTGGSGLLTIDTTSGNAAGNNISFSSKLDGTTAWAELLRLNAGTAGNILFTGAVGSGGRLGAINITNANNVTESAGITAASLTQAAGQGTTTFNGAVNTNTATGVNLTGNVQTVNAGITTTGNGTVTFSNAGLLTLNGDIAADGAVTQNGAATVTITAPGSITTTSDAVNFLRAVTLNGGASGLVSIDTRVGGGTGGDITFQSTLDASTAATASETLTLDAGAGGNILFTGAVGAGGRLGAINITNANNVTESAGITAASLTQAAGQGTTTFNGAVNTNTATGVNLAGNAQTVNAGITTTGAGTVTFSNAGLLTLNADISADGAVTQNGAGVVTINTDRAITTTADAVGFATNVTLNKTSGTGLLTINTTSGNAAGANITFSSKLDGSSDSAEHLTIAAGSGGAVSFNGAVGATRLGDVNITQARDVTVQSGFNARTLTQSQGATGAPSTTPSVGTTTINGAVNTTGNTSLASSGALNVTSAGSITAGAGSTVTLTTGSDMTLSGSVSASAGATLNVIGTDRILTQNGGTIASTNSAIALIADEMMLTSAINSGSGTVTLKPNNPADAIQLGVASASTNNSAATLELSDSELNTISTTGGLSIGAANNTGAITVSGALAPTTAQNGFTLLNTSGGIAINAPITYAAGNGNLTLTANGGGAAAGAITTSGSALDVSGTLAMNAATGVGTLTAPMVLSHAAGTTLAVTNSTSGGVFERADVGDLNVSSINNSAAAGGGINLNVGTNLNINGKVQNSIGNIQFVAGNDAAYTGSGGFGLSPASVAAGTLGAVNLNGQVIANNGGAISIYSTGAVKQSTTAAAGLQSIPIKGAVDQGALKVRTFNNGAQVGVIDLKNNLAGSGNSMGPITLEARLAGSINPPPYAQSNIEYKSINGTNISGIGTAADFSLVAPSQTIDLAAGASLSGSNVSLIATAGDVTLKSAITNAQINGGQSGGSLNLYATGNIVLENPGGDSAGVVIGKDLGTLDKLGEREFEKFDHALKLVATGDIRIHGTVQVTGDLALRANASAAEASGTDAAAGFGGGLGSVLIAGSAGNPVEVRAKNIVVGVKDASGNPLPVQNLVIDNSANVADSGKFFDTTLRAEEKLDVYLNGEQNGAGTSGSIIITGGGATAVSEGIAAKAAKSSALAALRAEDILILGVKGGTPIVTQYPERQTVNPLLSYTSNSSNIILKGGTATSNTAAGGGALAAADALILGTLSKYVDIGGNIELTGGTADSKGGGQTSAAAKIDPVNLRINTGGYIKLIGGEGAGARAAIVNSGDMEINIGGKFDYTYTDASGTHTVKDVGLLLAGGIGSGLFDRNNQPIKLYYDPSAQVLLLFPAINGGAGGGAYFMHTDVSKASAFVQSLSARGFDDSLMAYIIFAANEETRTGRIHTGVSNADDANKPSCN